MSLKANTNSSYRDLAKIKLSDLIDITHGFAFKGADFEKSNSKEKLIVLTPGNYSENGELHFSSKNTKRFTGDSPPEGYLFDIGDLTVVMTDLSSKMKILGKPAFIDSPNILHNQRIGRVLFKDESISPKYLFYFFRTRMFGNGVKSTATGTMVRHTAPKRILDCKVFLPKLSEQKRIVAILDEVFAGIDDAIANTQKNLANARDLFESYLDVVFTQNGEGWEKRTLKEVSLDFGRGKSKHRPRNDPKLYGGSYPFIQTGDVRNCDHVVTECSQFYSETGLAQSKLWPKGTICITIAANIAETGILGFDACFPDSLIGIVVNDKLAVNDFIEYLLQAVKARIKAKGKGSAQDNINLGTFQNEKFPFPSVEKQVAIADKLNRLSLQTQRLEAIYQQKLTALNELKQAILQKAFTGELTAVTAAEATRAKEEIAA
ncbi:MAG: restriction endonuclease subunit S [Leptolyngbya foveolarum]|uniref:Restriction endonuclease subunit S n=1 Tax=Leptolyngbya foveolarum TaxID=47253 RepID=A0A2W4UMA6_9CYAN|nr:MAG: restriction endonuclease subunit S [Leptolyngbya foveolarum]